MLVNSEAGFFLVGFFCRGNFVRPELTVLPLFLPLLFFFLGGGGGGGLFCFLFLFCVCCFLFFCLFLTKV